MFFPRSKYVMPLRILLGNDPAGNATPSADDSYWAQVWDNFETQAPWDLLGPLGGWYQGVFEAVSAAIGDPAPDTNVVTQYFANNPNVKQTIKDATNNITQTVPSLLSLVPNTLNTANWFVQYLPEIAIGAALLTVIFLFKNPETIRARR